MTDKGFIQKLNMATTTCFVVDDPKLNPLEILVISKKKKKVTELFEGNDNFEITCGQRTRIVRIFSFGELKITGWERGLKERGKKKCAHVYEVSETDGYAFWIYYAILQVRRSTWLERNVSEVLCFRMNIEDKDQSKLLDWFREYILSNRIRLRKISNQSGLAYLSGQISTVNKLWLIFSQYVEKHWKHLLFSIMGKIAETHRKITKTNYLNRIRQAYPEAKCNLLEGIGASSCTYVKIEGKEENYFLKGNEIYEFSGISNEIKACKLIDQSLCDKSCFIMAQKIDKDEKWICYPYMDFPSLKDMLKNRLLEEDEQELLGVFLLKVLEILHTLKIVHNDIRANNIIVETNKNGKIEKLYLVDFGCFAIKGTKPWKSHSFIAKKYCEDLCGDYRYNNNFVDDAASALALYSEVGGNNAEIKNALYELIGKSYTFLVN